MLTMIKLMVMTLALYLVACTGEEGARQQFNSVDQAQNSPVGMAGNNDQHNVVALSSSGEQTAPQIRRSVGKTTVPIRVDFDVARRIEPGQQFPVTLTVLTALRQGVLTLSLEAESGITLVSSQAQYLFDLREGQPETVEVQLLANLPGRHYLKLFIVVEGGDRAYTRVSSVPIQVLTGQVGAFVEKAGKDKTIIDAKGERIIRLNR